VSLTYLTIKTGHETFSDTILETLPKPLKNFEIPVTPILPITIRSIFLSVVYSNILSIGLPMVMYDLLEIYRISYILCLILFILIRYYE
jgi:hypothetical protein